jgi:hypothetical protein
LSLLAGLFEYREVVLLGFEPARLMLGVLLELRNRLRAIEREQNHLSIVA